MRYLYAILALGLLIALHELGHLAAARLLRMRVDRFAIGFGPPIVTLRRRHTDWVLGAIPFGGYVRIHGLNPHQGSGPGVEPGSFLARAWWARIVVLAAGSVVNAAVAFGVLMGLFLAGTHVPVKLTVGTVEPGSVAARAQLRPGDVIAAVNGVALGEWSDLVEQVESHPGTPLVLEVHRAEGPARVEVVPRAGPDGTGRIGVTQQYVYRSLPFREAFFESAGYLGRLVREGTQLLWRMARGRPGPDEATPVLLMKQASDVASSGLDAFLRVLVHLSAALAIFYLLPFPALDGGRIVLTVIEAIRKRPMNPKVETALHTLGFLVLCAVILLVAAGEWHRRRHAPAPAPNAAAPVHPDAGSDAGRP